MSHRYFFLLAFAIGCGDNVATLVRVDPESPGANCQYGGLAVSTGVDHNRDGTLADSEVVSTQYVCNGGSFVHCAPSDVVHMGSLTLRTAGDFSQLDGVTCLDGGLIIAGVAGELPALPDLGTVTGEVIIASNDDITSLNGFSALRRVGQTFLVQGNQALTDVSTLADVDEALSIDIVGNDSLADLAPFTKLDTLAHTLTIANNSSLTSLHGLENVFTAKGALILRGNSNLTDITALANLRSAVAVDVTGNASLASLSLPKLVQLDLRLVANDNPMLATVSAPELISMSEGVQISGNPALTTVSLPSLLSTGAVSFENDISLVSIDAHQLSFLTADLAFSNLHSLDTLGFGSLKAIGGTLRVYGNNPFSFSGFTRLANVGNLWVVSTAGMPDFTGLSALTKIAGNMTLQSNPQLASFVGLDNMTTIGGNLAILDNAAMTHSTAQAFANKVSVAGSVMIQ